MYNTQCTFKLFPSVFCILDLEHGIYKYFSSHKAFPRKLTSETTIPSHLPNIPHTKFTTTSTPLDLETLQTDKLSKVT